MKNESDTQILSKGIAVGLLLGTIITAAFWLGSQSGREVGRVEAAPSATLAVAAASASQPTVDLPVTIPTTTLPPPVRTSTTAPATPQSVVVEVLDLTGANGAVVHATLDGSQFALSGVVPNQTAVDRLVAAATRAYGPSITADLAIDGDLESPGWLPTAQRAITLLPMILDGTITMVDNTVQLTGTAPDSTDLASFERAVSETTNLEVVNAVHVTGEAHPMLKMTLTSGVLTLRGVLPRSEIALLISNAATATYGVGNVRSDLTVSDAVYEAFWMYTIPESLGPLSSFAAFSVEVVEGTTVASFDGASLFLGETDQLGPEGRAGLELAIGLLIRDGSIGLSLGGDTTELGAKRAQAVLLYLETAGIEPSRLSLTAGGSDQTPGSIRFLFTSSTDNP